MPAWRPASVLFGLALLVPHSCGQQPGCGSSGTGKVYIGGLFDYRITDRDHFTFAAQLIENKTDGFFDELLPNVTLAVTTKDSGCNVNQATTQMWQLAQEWGKPLHGVIGARCSSASMGVATLTRLKEVPQISARSTNPGLSDTAAYSHFFRTCAPDDRQGPALQKLVASFGWSKVGIIATNLAYPLGLAEQFKAGWGGTVSQQCTIPLNNSRVHTDRVIDCLQALSALPPSQRPRVILLSAHSVDASDILSVAAAARWQPDAIWVGTDGWTGAISPSSSYQLLGLRPAHNDAGAEYKSYLQRWQSAQQRLGKTPDQALCGYCAETVDAVVAMATALTTAMAAGADAAEKMANIDNGTFVLKHLRNVSFAGVSGSIAFDSKGDRETSMWDLMHFEADAASWNVSATFDVNLAPASVWFDGSAVPTDSYNGSCSVGADCADSAGGKFCDTTIDSGTCVGSISKGQCAARSRIGEAITLFNPVDVACTPTGAGQYDCTSPAPTGGSQKHTAASLCAPYLPDTMMRSSKDEPITMPMCCRADDNDLNHWIQDQWQDFDIEFGQCANCLHVVRKLFCQVACDMDNYRFLTGGTSTMALENTSVAVRRDASACTEFCTLVHLACRSVVWSDEVARLHPEPQGFCERVLKLQVTPLGQVWDGVDTGTDSQRVCTPLSATDDIHCVGEGMHGALGVVATLMCVFVILSQVIAEKCEKLEYIPGATVVLFTGLFFGMLLKEVLSPWEVENSGTHLFSDLVQFNTDIFGFLLLPVIIFSSSFNMEHHASVFFHLYIKRISFFAVVGTLMAIGFTGGLIYAAENLSGGMLAHDMSFAEAMMFGSLISAVDPVATLSAFASVGVDPRVYSIIYGESILNDAVAIVMFSVFKQVAESKDPASSSTLALTVTKKIMVLSCGSLCCGLVWGVLVTLLYKIYGATPPPDNDAQRRAETSVVLKEKEIVDGEISNPVKEKKEEEEEEEEGGGGEEEGGGGHSHMVGESDSEHEKHMGMADAAVFFVASLSSYYVAEAFHFSGIISALVCGIMCNQFAVWNMSTDAREYARAFYVVLSEISDHLLMLWVGLLYYISLEHFTASFSLVALTLVVCSRALSVFTCGALVNCRSESDNQLPMTTQIMMFSAGLRGAVALALVMQMPTSSSEEIASACLFVIFWTNIVLGGVTTPLVGWLKIPNEGDGSLDVSSFEFTEKEMEWLGDIDALEERLAKYFLVNGTDTNKSHSEGTARGRSDAAWKAAMATNKLSRDNSSTRDQEAG